MYLSASSIYPPACLTCPTAVSANEIRSVENDGLSDCVSVLVNRTDGKYETRLEGVIKSKNAHSLTTSILNNIFFFSVFRSNERKNIGETKKKRKKKEQQQQPGTSAEIDCIA